MPDLSEWSDSRLNGLERDVDRLHAEYVPRVVEHSSELKSLRRTLQRIEKDVAAIASTVSDEARARSWTAAQKASVIVPLGGTLITCAFLVATKGAAPAPGP